MNIILIGFKSSGKTMTGRRLAKITGKKFFDTDAMIQEKYNNLYYSLLSIIEIYKNLGESKFRDLEEEVLSDLLLVNNAVIASGGGTILKKYNLMLLKRIGYLVYLDISFATVIKRICNNTNNCFLGVKKGTKSISNIFKSRLNIYKSAANFSVKVDNLTEEMVVNKIIMHLK
jgi:shikimate kinase